MLFVFVSVLVLDLVSLSKTNILEAFTIKPLVQYVSERGYPIEKHVIETDDGFKLTYHRVPHGRQGPGQGHGHPVLLAHGLLQSSALYLAANDALGYLLADAGFDVWLVNARGNTYSRRHLKFHPSDRNFWDFSFHEIGHNDLPAAIEHILKVTGRPTLSYVGFSMGTTVFWVLADSWGAKYMDRVDTMVAIAPTARTSGMFIVKNPKFRQTITTLLNFYNLINAYEVRRFSKAEALFVKALCANASTRSICNNVLAGLLTLYHDAIDFEGYYASTQYMPNGTSVKNVRHFLQVAETASFQQYDYGADNSRRYPLQEGTSTPPVYDLKKVTCPVFFAASEMDMISVKEDVDWLASQLPEMPQYLFPDVVSNYNHLDYFFSKDVKHNFSIPLVEFLSERVKSRQN